MRFIKDIPKYIYIKQLVNEYKFGNLMKKNNLAKIMNKPIPRNITSIAKHHNDNLTLMTINILLTQCYDSKFEPQRNNTSITL